MASFVRQSPSKKQKVQKNYAEKRLDFSSFLYENCGIVISIKPLLASNYKGEATCGCVAIQEKGTSCGGMEFLTMNKFIELLKPCVAESLLPRFQEIVRLLIENQTDDLSDVITAVARYENAKASKPSEAIPGEDELKWIIGSGCSFLRRHALLRRLAMPMYALRKDEPDSCLKILNFSLLEAFMNRREIRDSVAKAIRLKAASLERSINKHEISQGAAKSALVDLFVIL